MSRDWLFDMVASTDRAPGSTLDYSVAKFRFFLFLLVIGILIGPCSAPCLAEEPDLPKHWNPKQSAGANNGRADLETNATNSSIWPRIVIDTEDVPDFVAPVDLNNDGRTDILAVDGYRRGVFWYQNTPDTQTTWTRYLVYQEESDNNAVAEDFNGDGFVDIAGFTENDSYEDVVTLWSNTDGQGQSWEAQELSAGGYEWLAAADCNQDGNLDLVLAGNTVYWLENPGSDAGEWIRHTVDADPGVWRVENVFAADIDGDGDKDILGAAGKEFSWWENQQGGSVWVKHVIEQNLPGDASCILAVDVDNDQDLDVVGAEEDGGLVSLYLNTNGDASIWYEVEIDGALPGAEQLFAKDMDGDGDQDLLVQSDNQGIACYVNDGGTGHTWSQKPVDPSGQSVAAADLFGIGVNVIFGASWEGTSWWRNKLLDNSAGQLIPIYKLLLLKD